MGSTWDRMDREAAMKRKAIPAADAKRVPCVPASVDFVSTKDIFLSDQVACPGAVDFVEWGVSRQGHFGACPDVFGFRD